ncbi:MAG: rod shape-determining protein MreC [Aquificaceae bacterium]|nr:rod shape-determining protein MreC [Aquificaceae bacterium]
MKKHGFALFVLFFGIFLYFINLSTLPYLNSLYSYVRYLVQPLFELKGILLESTTRAVNTYLFLTGVSAENQRLKRELEECALYKVQLNTCESSLIDLGKMIELTPDVKHYSVMYAHVIAYDPSGNDTFILINRGQGAGAEEGMVVFHGYSLLGIVDRVYGGSSRVRTVYSEDFSISVAAGGKAYIYKGGYPYGSLLHVNLEDDLKGGDPIFLRVPGKNFPSLLIGTVHSVSQEGKSFFKRVQVKPAVDVRRASLCVVIKEKL